MPFFVLFINRKIHRSFNITQCDQHLKSGHFCGEMIELETFCLIKTKFETNSSCFSTPVTHVASSEVSAGNFEIF